MNDINRRLHEALYGKRPPCSECGYSHMKNPDYCADVRLVIEAMREAGHHIFFAEYPFCDSFLLEGSIKIYKFGVPIDLIMDKTGKLAKLALEWIEGRKG